MSTLQIRHLPEDVFQALAFRADKEHRSLAQQAIVELRKLPEIEARKRRLQTLQDIESELTGAHRTSAFYATRSLTTGRS